MSMTNSEAMKQIHFDKLAELYSEMDNLYCSVTEKYDFQCCGCKENCCYTRFFHHTLIEFNYLMHAFATLTRETKDTIITKALNLEEKVKSLPENKTVRIMCPLNHKGKCLLYHARPMICRLHGIPHELTNPKTGKRIHPGCDQFDNECGAKEYITFDRTTLYVKLANLEKEVRQHEKLTGNPKRTIAQMLITQAT